MHLTENDIYLEEVNDDFWLFYSAIMHEVKGYGKEHFYKEHTDFIEDYRKDWSHRDFCFLLSILEWINPEFKYDESVKLEKYMLDPYSLDTYINFDPEIDDEEINLDTEYERALSFFRKRGFLFADIGEAV